MIMIRFVSIKFNLYAEKVMRDAALDETGEGIRITGDQSTTNDMWMMSHCRQRQRWD